MTCAIRQSQRFKRIVEHVRVLRTMAMVKVAMAGRTLKYLDQT